MRLAAVLVLAWLWAVAAGAAVIEFRHADVVRSNATAVPPEGWRRAAVPLVVRAAAGEAVPAIWVRFRFDRAVAGNGPLALFTDRVRERYVVFLNGVDIYRTNGTADDASFGWHRPSLVPLSSALLRARGNEIVYRVESGGSRPLAVGMILVGPDVPLRAIFRGRTLLTVDGPRIIAAVILILSLGALLFWSVRPRERVFGWLALVGLVWCFWDLQYFIYGVPVDATLFWHMNVDSLFLVVWAAYCFSLEFFVIAGRQRIIACSAVAALAIVAVRETLLALGRSDAPSFLLILPLSAATLYLMVDACRRDPRAENILMLSAVALTTGFGFQDLGLIANAFRGAGFQLQPYGELLVFLAFGFALGRRMLVALATIEDVNFALETRVAEATAQLGHSEAERRRLEVANAVDSERERMMREIHDGIGSSLITALAVAQRERQSPNTIATLKRSIADLRIGVDSLEPINGDVVMLLANLRHRMDRELGDAGLVFVWKAMSAPPLPWLDAVGALHILRILQEAISNILKHADASRVEIDCAASSLNGLEGVLVMVTDNGHGFERRAGHGRGLMNIGARAEALNAHFTCDSALGTGTRLSLWLPCAPPL